eukprot:366020-Chlamydomonas_euryale.AAC.4
MLNIVFAQANAASTGAAEAAMGRSWLGIGCCRACMDRRVVRVWSTHLLQHLNADGALGDVPDDASLAVVPLVGHALRAEHGATQAVRSGPPPTAPHAFRPVYTADAAVHHAIPSNADAAFLVPKIGSRTVC